MCAARGREGLVALIVMGERLGGRNGRCSLVVIGRAVGDGKRSCNEFIVENTATTMHRHCETHSSTPVINGVGVVEGVRCWFARSS